MSDDSPPPHIPDAPALRTVRALLDDAGYREDVVCGRAECRSWSELRAQGSAALRHRLKRFPDPLANLCELFVVGAGLPGATARARLGDERVAALVATGLLEERGGDVRAAVALTPVDGLVFASDRFQRHRDHAADFVLGPGGVTRLLADLTLRDPIASALDLGCGAGVLGALVARHADRVVATDVNPRAVAFGRFNAALNGLDGVECREGSLFEPVAGERFDLIVCNPPYVISPRETYVYRDGGTELCREIVRQAPHHLTEGGVLQMMAEWPQGDDGDWRREVGSWLDGVECDAWVLRTHAHDPVTYAARWLVQEYPADDTPQEAFEAWVSYLEGLGVASVAGGLVMLRPTRGRAPVRAFREVPRIVPPSSASLRRWLAAQDILAATGDDAQLLDTRLAPSPELERRRRDHPAVQGWASHPDELRLRSGLVSGARVDPVASELVGLLDGRRTPREAMSLLAQRLGVPAEPFLQGLPIALRRLLNLGILVPAEEADSQREVGGSSPSSPNPAVMGCHP